MPKIGRNELCPCGSGKKYKHCCLDKDRAAELATLAATRAKLEAQHEQFHALIDEEHAALLQSQALTVASNAVVDLVDAGRLDEAEHAAHDLLVRYPEVHDGHDRLGMVYEARGMHREAADCYRKVVDFVHNHPDQYDPEFEEPFLELIAKLDPPTPAA